MRDKEIRFVGEDLLGNVMVGKDSVGDYKLIYCNFKIKLINLNYNYN